MGDVPLVEPDAVPGGGGGPLHVEQVQAAGPVVVRPGDGDVVQHGGQLPRPEGDGEPPGRGDEPAGLLHPGVGLLRLLLPPEHLPEQAVVVVQPHPVPVQAQGGDGVQEAGGQPAQPPVAQGGLGLQGLHGGQVPAKLLQIVPRLVPQAQGQQLVGQQLAQEKLGGKIVQLPLPLRGGQRPGPVPAQGQQGLIELPVVALVRRPAEPGPGQVPELISQQHLTSSPFASGGPGAGTPASPGTAGGPASPHSCRAGPATASCPPGWRGCSSGPRRPGPADPASA